MSDETQHQNSELASVSESVLSSVIQSAGGSSAASDPEIVQAKTLEDGTNAWEFCVHVHEYVSHYIALADAKAGVVFTLAGAILAYLSQNDLIAIWVVPLEDWSMRAFLVFMADLCLVMSCIFAVYGILPRTKGVFRGYVFWSAIANRSSASEYASEVLSLGDTRRAEELAAHVYELSSVCDAKYRSLRACFLAGSLGASFALLALFL